MTVNSLPNGFVTFLATDIVDSSRICNILGNQKYQETLRNPHNDRILELFIKHNGNKFKGVGDGFYVAFQHSHDALNCAREIQLSLHSTPIRNDNYEITVRIAVHRAEIEVDPDSEGDYISSDVNYLARITAITNGAQILVSETTYNGSPSKQYFLWKSWFNRRLKSFEEEPQTVCELLWDGNSRGEPGATWLPDWFKGDLSLYISRPEKEKDVIREYIGTGDSNKYRLVTITGLGGFGKTRLAVRCAVDMAGIFDGGVHFVQLAHNKGMTESSEKVLSAVTASLLNLEKLDTISVLQTLKARDEKKTLFLLDSFETIASDSARNWIQMLLSSTRNTYFLVASQKPVELPNVERLIDINDGMTEIEAIELFKHRAENSKGKWNPTGDELISIGIIVKRLEYMPLAIELAAGWLRLKTLAEIVKELENKLLGTVTSEFRAPQKIEKPEDRQSSLRFCLDWSYELLDPSLQLGFRMLGLFGGTFTAEAARMILQQIKTDSIIFQLHEASLLKRVEHEGLSRHGFHNLTREYAFGKLRESAEWADCVSNFLQIYSTFVQENCTKEKIEDSRKRNLIEQEWNNLTNCLTIGIESNNLMITPAIATGLFPFIYRQARWIEGRDLFKRVLQWYENQSTPNWYHLRSLHYSLGLIDWQCANFDSAIQYLQKAIKLDESNRGENDIETATSVHALALVYMSQANFRDAEPLMVRSLKIRETVLGLDNSETATSLHDLSLLYQHQGKFEKAQQPILHALEIRKNAFGESNPDTSRSMLVLGGLYLHMKKYQLAENIFAKVLSIDQQILGEYHPETAMCYNMIAITLQNQKKFDLAERNYKQALEIRKSTLGVNHPAYVETLNNLATLNMDTENYTEAENLLKVVLEKNRITYEAPHPVIANTLYNLSFAYYHQGRCIEAEPLLVEALLMRNASLGEQHPDSKQAWKDLQRMRKEIHKGKKY